MALFKRPNWLTHFRVRHNKIGFSRKFNNYLLYIESHVARNIIFQWTIFFSRCLTVSLMYLIVTDCRSNFSSTIYVRDNWLIWRCLSTIINSSYCRVARIPSTNGLCCVVMIEIHLDRAHYAIFWSSRPILILWARVCGLMHVLARTFPSIASIHLWLHEKSSRLYHVRRPWDYNCNKTV